MTDRLTTLLHDEADRLDVRLPSPEQLRRASQRKRAARRSGAAALAAATTIAVVVPLTVSNPLGTNHRTPGSQTQPTGNTQHPSSSLSPSTTYPTQFAGLPAVGAPVSLPANGTLVLNISPRAGGDWHVYADGRIIWQRWSQDGAPLVVPKGADPLHTSYVQQRLTPLGAQLLTSRIRAIGGTVGLFGHDVVLVDPTDGDYADWYQVCNNGHLIYSQVLPPKIAAGATETPAQKRALARIDTLLTDSTRLLPASAWADRTIRPYVPPRYQLSWDRAAPDPSSLPSPAREALAKALRESSAGHRPITTEQAQTLLAAFRQSHVKIDQSHLNGKLIFDIRGQGRNFSIGLVIGPALPSSALSDANGC